MTGESIIEFFKTNEIQLRSPGSHRMSVWNEHHKVWCLHVRLNSWKLLRDTESFQEALDWVNYDPNKEKNKKP
jgi:hypothetical protein